MNTLRIARQITAVVVIMLLGHACAPNDEAESNQTAGFIDSSSVRTTIEALGSQFSEAFRNQDSVALANFYASDGMLGSVKGHDNLVSAFHRMISNASEPELLFKTNSITTDDEYIIELGIAQWADNQGNVKSEGKYLVVWKQEDGEWKMYRDWGL